MDRLTLTHEAAAADLPAYIIGALEPSEAEALSAHLEGCALCREEQARLEQTLGLIGTAVPSIDPPADLRARLLDQLDESDRHVVVPPIELAPAHGIFSRARAFGLAAAAVLLAGILIWSIVLLHNVRATRGDLNAANQHQSTNTEILADVSRTIPLVADGAPDAYGNLYIGSESNEAVLVVDDLPPTPANRTYQVWLVNGSSRVSAGLFSVDDEGSAMVTIRAPQPLSAYQSLGITSEPGPRGSLVPTGERVAGCPLHS
jgi:anti-sigma-K factor RskA